jgi:hypothetical protein
MENISFLKKSSKSTVVILVVRLTIPTLSHFAVVQEILIINTNERLKRKPDSCGIK